MQLDEVMDFVRELTKAGQRDPVFVVAENVLIRTTAVLTKFLCQRSIGGDLRNPERYLLAGIVPLMPAESSESTRFSTHIQVVVADSRGF